MAKYQMAKYRMAKYLSPFRKRGQFMSSNLYGGLVGRPDNNHLNIEEKIEGERGTLSSFL